MRGDLSRREQRRFVLLLIVPLGFLVVFFLYPLGSLIRLSVFDGGWTLRHYERILEVPAYLRVLHRTLWMGAVTAAICLVLGYPLAYRLAAASPRGKAILLVCILIPFWTNLLVRAFGWMVMLHPSGLINAGLMAFGLIETPLALVHNTTGALIGMTQIMLPYMVLPIAAVMMRMDPSLIAAARSLGAGPIDTFLRVYLPLTLPGVMAGTLLVFTISLGFFVIPALLGGTRDVFLAQLVEFNINTVLNWGLAAALSTTLLAATFALYLIAHRWFGIDALWGDIR